MTKSSEKANPARSGSNSDQAGRAAMDRSLLQQDPVEGSRKTVDLELDRQKQSSDTNNVRSRRQALRDQVEEETELPQKGSA
ncbi:hypothetical protein [Mesorhizobium sp.]|uniref:hypothetical protein n=1 Tax=Mesorhizobium sp. TaxID=1871066 RepID=UPI000FE53D41|nr:hypothetical protein [Mesorhizobium sp.]RWC26389.1 MAG: hypothetical protein EOS27_25525 [Mesorhizobium sp.]TIX21046.1 MAG: hypothetical protein E5V35_30780 [Mesorhizobium sp.]